MPLRILCAFLFLGLLGQSVSPSIAGIWVLNPSLTQRPDEIGFSPAWGGAGGEAGGRSGGRGRRGGSGSSGGAAGVPPVSRESIDDSTRVQQLTGEARTPPAQLTIVEKAASVSIADDQGHSRTFHPNGTLEQLTIGTVALPTTARWDAGSLVVVFDVESGRQLRYTYTPAANPTRLLVDIRFIERGHEGDHVRLTYETPDAHNRALLSGQPGSPAAAAPAASSPAVSGVTQPAARPPVLPPGSELRGLTTIGTTVEDLTAQAAACGLDQAKVKTSIARILADAGFKTQPDHNEETYVLVSIVTSRLQDGVCISRYDASLVSQGDATFPYLNGLVAVEVPLLRQGGMAGGSPAAHASAVMEAIAKAVNGFVSQIRATNKGNP
jgi:hypothetical protein